MNFYAVVKKSGEIQRIEYVPHKYFLCDATVNDETHYYDYQKESLVLKSEITFETEKEGLSLVLTGLPDGLLVETNGTSAVTDAQAMTIEYDVPGTYTIKLSGRVDYLDKELEVTVGDT